MKISRLVMITASLLVAPLPTYGQGGIMAGWNRADASVEVNGSEIDIEPRNGFNVGLFRTRGDLIGYIAGLYYSQKGFDTDTAAVKLDYIEVPVMLRVKIPYVRVYGGVNLAFEINCKVENFPAPGGVPFVCNTDTESVELGWKVGAGARLQMFSLDVAYVWASTDIWKPDNVSVKSRVLQVDLGLSF